MYYTYSSTGQQSDAGLAQCPCVPPPADTNYPCASSCGAHDQDNRTLNLQSHSSANVQ